MRNLVWWNTVKFGQYVINVSALFTVVDYYVVHVAKVTQSVNLI